MRDHAVNLERNRAEGRFDRRQIEVQRAGVRTVVAEAGRGAAAELAGGGLEHHAQRTAFGVAAEQRALRTLEHFDALDIEQRGVKAMLAAEVDAVEIDADALLARGLVGIARDDAAQTDGERGLARFEGGDAKAGNGAVGKVDQALDVAVLDVGRADHRDRDRGLLEVGFALGGGDDDFLDRHAIGQRGGGRRCGLCGLRLVSSKSGRGGQSDDARTSQQAGTEGMGELHDITSVRCLQSYLRRT